MFNLYQIVQGAQGGQAINHLARQFELSTDEAGKAVNSLIPALSSAFLAKASQPAGYAEILAALNDDQHRQAYAQAAGAENPFTRRKGAAIVAGLFGSDEVTAQVAEQAARFSGVPAPKLLEILPVLASIIVGGTAAALQGLGGWADLPGAKDLGGVKSFGGAAGPFTGFAAGPNTATFTVPGFGGAAGNPFAGFAAAPGGFPQGAVPPAVQAGWDALAKMFQPKSG
ncbi:MAG: DUF937 domain-containing protein [Beijerinckiaceae bacterium]|nr:DUF937 domain-containing protein [Beijerinckiaceae bacterium]